MLWKSCVVAAGLGLVWVVWTRTTVGVEPPDRNTLPATIVDSTLRVRANADSTPEPLPEVAPGNSASTDTVTGNQRVIAVSVDSAPLAMRVPPASSAAAPGTPVPLPPRPGVVQPRLRPQPAPAQKSAGRTRWVRATARDWVRVRAAAHPKSRTVALIGPDTRVQLGDSRQGWVRVRSSGISGWAESTQFFAMRR